jgi:hypothetical protein
MFFFLIIIIIITKAETMIPQAYQFHSSDGLIYNMSHN